jgi:broad specificity phosphatase PhoE
MSEMTIEITFLRHAETLRDEKIPVSKWGLSPEGLKQAKAVRTVLKKYPFDYVISSGEDKAYETAKFFENMISSRIKSNPLFNELNRDTGPYLSNDEYPKAVQYAMDTPSKSVHEWETVDSALDRFKYGVEQLNQKYQSKTLLVVSHGIVLTVFFASLLNCMNMAFDRWKNLRFCAYGIVKDGAVIKDIVDL